MEQIFDYQEWVSNLPQNQVNKGWMSNLYLMPAQLQTAAKEHRLYGQVLPSGGFVLLTDEGAYDSLYFKIKSVDEFTFMKREKPVMAELVYQDKQWSTMQMLEEMLLAKDFYLRARCVQFAKKLTSCENAYVHGENAIADSAKTFSKKYGEYQIIPAVEADKEQILKLWQDLLSPYDFHDSSKAELDENLAKGRVICVRDAAEKVCGASYFDQQGRRFSSRHVVVDPAHQGKGLGAALLAFSEAYGILAGCRNVTGWVALDNDSSLAIHRKWMEETDRKLAQYVLE